MKTHLPNKSGWIVTAAAGMSVLAYVVFFFLPRQAKLGERRAETQEKQLYALHSTNSAAAVAKATSELNEARQFLKVWRQTSPTEDTLLALFHEINQVAQMSQSRNLRLEPEAVQKMAAIWRMPFKVAAEGNYHELHRFVHGLESLSSAIWVSDLRFERQRESESLRIALTLTIFGTKRDFSSQAGLAD